jgi:hypothetical protein
MINDDNSSCKCLITPFLQQLYSLNLVEKAKELKVEQKKSDALLFQMLPSSVAVRLKHTGKVR